MLDYLIVAQQHLTKTIEVTRVNLFNVITQYRAIFPDEETKAPNDTIPMETRTNKRFYMEGLKCNGDRLFQSWMHAKVHT